MANAISMQVLHALYNLVDDPSSHRLTQSAESLNPFENLTALALLHHYVDVAGVMVSAIVFNKIRMVYLRQYLKLLLQPFQAAFTDLILLNPLHSKLPILEPTSMCAIHTPKVSPTQCHLKDIVRVHINVRILVKVLEAVVLRAAGGERASVHLEVAAAGAEHAVGRRLSRV